MTKLVDLNGVRRAWNSRYGATRAGRMMAGASGYAYDSALRPRSPVRDRDQDPDDGGGDPRLEQIKTFLKNCLDPQDWATLQKMMGALSPEGEEPGEGSEGQDEPESFPGRPRPGGAVSGREVSDNGEPRRQRLASDARPGSYFSMFPSNAAVDAHDYGRR